MPVGWAVTCRLSDARPESSDWSTGGGCGTGDTSSAIACWVPWDADPPGGALARDGSAGGGAEVIGGSDVPSDVPSDVLAVIDVSLSECEAEDDAAGEECDGAADDDGWAAVEPSAGSVSSARAEEARVVSRTQAASSSAAPMSRRRSVGAPAGRACARPSAGCAHVAAPRSPPWRRPSLTVPSPAVGDQNTGGEPARSFRPEAPSGRSQRFGTKPSASTDSDAFREGPGVWLTARDSSETIPARHRAKLQQNLRLLSAISHIPAIGVGPAIRGERSGARKGPMERFLFISSDG